MDNLISKEKTRIRSFVLQKRNHLHRIEIEKLSSVIEKYMLDYINKNNFQSVATYSAMATEVIPVNPVDCPAIKYCASNSRLKWDSWTVADQKAHLDNPIEYTWNDIKDKLDAIIVPMVAFDSKNYRLGYGKGLYDRWLREFKGHKIGIAFSCQQVLALPVESHDVKLDVIITENFSDLFK